MECGLKTTICQGGDHRCSCSPAQLLFSSPPRLRSLTQRSLPRTPSRRFRASASGRAGRDHSGRRSSWPRRAAGDPTPPPGHEEGAPRTGCSGRHSGRWWARRNGKRGTVNSERGLVGRHPEVRPGSLFTVHRALCAPLIEPHLLRQAPDPDGVGGVEPAGSLTDPCPLFRWRTSKRRAAAMRIAGQRLGKCLAIVGKEQRGGRVHGTVWRWPTGPR